MTGGSVDSQKRLAGGEMRIAWALAGIAVLVQMLTNGRYGYFRDELYYLAASDHLALGYVDFAPLIAWLTHASRFVFGDSLHALRLLPALAFGAEVLLTGFITRELGGRRAATLVACVSVLVAPVILGNATRLSMNPLEPLFWMGCIYFLLRALNRQQPRLLLWCGVLLGLGLENKHSTAFFLGALVVGLLLTSDRRLLATKWFWIAALIVLVLAVPNLVWQYQHHFPTLEDLRNVRATHKNVELGPLPFIGQQIMMLNPASVIVWIAGLGFLLGDRRGKRFRALGWAYVAFLAMMIVLRAKDYYLAPIYPMLYAAGGVFWEKLPESHPRLRGLRVAVPAIVFAFGLVSAPLVLPILPPQEIVPYIQALGIKLPQTETGMSGLLPQHFADEFGWPEMVETVARLYDSLPPDERSRTAILAGNYGGAGAIDFFGPRYGLPKAISAHQNYYYWGPRQYTGQSIIMLEWTLEDARSWCGSVQEGPVNAPYFGMGWEHYTILVCHDFKEPLAEAWPRLKTWN
ncbi:MAG TPA: glycosyltransferase family 39 protein [Terriglobia bacterium]|nr:glycosyltransferase family 39 protein [Terriglobia bacterium]